jgi:hypothetical protein
MVAVRVIDICEVEKAPTVGPELTLVPPLAARARLIDSANDFGSSELVMQRRRLAAVVLGLVFALLLLWAVSGLFGDSAQPLEARPDLPSAHTVTAGDSLWGIMRDRYPNSDIRSQVDDLAARLGGSELSVGQVIVFTEIEASE